MVVKHSIFFKLKIQKYIPNILFIYKKINRSIDKRRSVVFHCIKREQNVLAHQITRWALIFQEKKKKK